MSDLRTDTIYFLPNGSATEDPNLGRILELLPGYFVNPRQCGMVTNVNIECTSSAPDDIRSLRETLAMLRATAVAIVQRHAAVYARDVPIRVVESICGALGDISIDEATAGLDREQTAALIRKCHRGHCLGEDCPIHGGPNPEGR